MISPHRYAHQVRATINANVGALVSADWLLAMLRDGANADTMAGSIDIPACIPAKYHDAFRRVVMIAMVRAMFGASYRRATLKQRHQIVQSCYKALGR